MPFSFSVDKPEDLARAFRKLKAKCEENNIHMRGDEKSGEILSDGIEGRYNVDANDIEITVTKKPSVFFTNSRIESEIRKIFREII